MKHIFQDLIAVALPAVPIIVAGFVLWLVLSRFMGSWHSERLKRIRGLTKFTAVPTSSPYDAPDEAARRAAEKNLNERFSVIRVVVLLVLVLGVVVGTTLPFLNRLPQTLLSFLVAIALAVVGVAARPLIENFISGMVLSFSRQLRVGDTVLLDADHYGTVEDINPTHTVVKLWDWRRYVVPNSSMLQKEVISYSHKDQFLWTHIAFHVTPRADLDVVEELAILSAKESTYATDYEEPQFWVKEMLVGSTLCWVAAWAKTPDDAWYLRSEIRKKLSMRLRDAGIDTQLETHQISRAPASSSR